MTTVAAAVARYRRAFSGSTTARVVGDVGGGRDGRLRPFGHRTIMIAHAHAWLFRRGGFRSSVMDDCLHLMRATCAVWGARLPRSTNRRRGRGKSLTSLLSTRCPLLLASTSQLRAPLHSPASRFAFACRRQPQLLHFSQSWGWIPCHGLNRQ
jgi:hypothetical protein